MKSSKHIGTFVAKGYASQETKKPPRRPERLVLSPVEEAFESM